MRRFKKASVAAALAALTATSLLTGWGGGSWDDPAARAAKVKRIADAKLENTLDDLDATDAQRKIIGAVQSRLLAEGTPLFTSNGDVKKVLFEQWKAERPDPTKVHAVVDERFDAFRAFAHKVVDAAVEVHATLTTEQRQELSERFVRH